MGAETRIAVAEDIVLDFAGLFSPIGEEKQAVTAHCSGREGGLK